MSHIPGILPNMRKIPCPATVEGRPCKNFVQPGLKGCDKHPNGHAVIGTTGGVSVSKPPCLKGGRKDEDKPKATSFYEGKGTTTPWGRAQYGYKYGPGVNSYGCAGHGGFKVAAGKLKKMHPALAAVGGDDGWFEEDCDWAAVAVAFPEMFTQKDVDYALESLIRWNPDAYEGFSGVTLEQGESPVKDERVWKEAHHNSFIAVRSSSPDADGNVSVELRRPFDGRTAHMVMPREEYDDRLEEAKAEGSRWEFATTEDDDIIRPVLRENRNDIQTREELKEYLAENPDEWALNTSQYQTYRGTEWVNAMFENSKGEKLYVRMSEKVMKKRWEEAEESFGKRFMTQNEEATKNGEISYAY